MNQPKTDKLKLVQKARKDLGELYPQEIDLLLMIRTKYRFGRIEIETRDGLPVDVLKTVERKRLGEFSTYPQTNIA